MAHILVVDDEAPFRSFICDVIKRMGHIPIAAGDGREALEIYKTRTVDLAFVDVNMPEMGGIDFLEHVKEQDPDAVIIMMTGFPRAETIMKTIEDDGYTYITKPIDISQIMDLVPRGLKAREQRRGQGPA